MQKCFVILRGRVERGTVVPSKLTSDAIVSNPLDVCLQDNTWVPASESDCFATFELADAALKNQAA